jgi:zinc transport system substrate-binding protein
VRARRLLLLVGCLLVLAGCHRKPHPRAKVVTTIFPIFDLTRRIAGPDADVVMLEPAEVSPHGYAPSAGAVEQSAGASLAVLIGLDLDAWLPLLMERASPTARILKLADRVPTLPRQESLTEEGEETKRRAAAARGQPDPRGESGIDVHVWLDPQRALLMARAIADELCRIDPDHTTEYRKRGLELTSSLDALDKEIEARTLSWKQRRFATLHDSFRYYAARYRLEIAAVVEQRTGVRPPLRYEGMVLARVRERHAAGVFGEPQLDSQPARTVAQAANLPYGVLDPLGGTGAVLSYEALLRADTDALEKVMREAPAVPAPADAGG